MKKILTIAAFGAGYVLGAKAGKGRYEEIKDNFQNLWGKDEVQQGRDALKEKASGLADTAKEKAGSLKERTDGTGGDGTGGEGAEAPKAAALPPVGSSLETDGVEDRLAGGVVFDADSASDATHERNLEEDGKL